MFDFDTIYLSLPFTLLRLYFSLFSIVFHSFRFFAIFVSVYLFRFCYWPRLPDSLCLSFLSHLYKCPNQFNFLFSNTTLTGLTLSLVLISLFLILFILLIPSTAVLYHYGVEILLLLRFAYFFFAISALIL